MLNSFRKLLFSTCSLFFISQRIFSIGAVPYPIAVNQADGTTVTIVLKGDERNHYTVTTDGYRILRNDAGIFEYANISASGSLISSGQKVHNIIDRSSQEKMFVNTLTKNIVVKEPNQSSALRSPAQYFKSSSVLAKTGGVTGQFKLLVIMANFSDTQTTYSQTSFSNMLNQAGYKGTGSMRDFYLENSNNTFDATSVVTAWVKVPKTHDYYGPDTKWGEFAYEAVKAAYLSGVDLSQFDNNGDGELDGVAIFHQGHGQEATADTKDIWSHSWGLSATYTKSQRTFGGIVADGYFTQPELNGSGTSQAAIGVVCHEFAHLLGALDFYDTDYEDNGQQDGTGYWDLMASGAYNGNISGNKPAHHNPYTKLQFGWVKKIQLDNPGKDTISPVLTSRKVYQYNTNTENEYFLIENRIKQGFDSYLPGEGLLIYHVDENYINAHNNANDVNASAHQGFYIKAAGNALNAASCPFPGSNNVVAFHDKTNPSSLSWNDEVTNKSITKIEKIGTDVAFEFMELQDGIPQRFSAEIASETSVLVNWMKSIEDYPVLIAYSATNQFGEPVDGDVYSPEMEIPGGGKVLYYGDNTLEILDQVQSTEKLHFYQIWSNKGQGYSVYLEDAITHPNSAFFYVYDRNDNPINDATVKIGEVEGKTNSLGEVMLKGEFSSKLYHSFTIEKGGYEIEAGAFQSSPANLFGVYMMKDKLEAPTHLTSNIDYKKVSLKWNPVINEDFSNYKPFSISIPNWTFVDKDRAATHRLEGIEFENEGYTGSFIVFNGYDEGFIEQGIAVGSYGGNQFLACVSSAYGVNNDWLISPEVEITESTYLSFMARSMKYPDLKLDRIRVLVSENGPAIESFKLISSGTNIEVPEDWTEYVFDLKKYIGKKIHFSINCVSQNAFILMLDLIRLTNEPPSEMDMAAQKVPSIPALTISQTEKAEQSLKTALVNDENQELVNMGGINYYIYRDDQLIGVNYGMSQSSITDTPSTCGPHKYSIEAEKNSLTSTEVSLTDTIANCYKIDLHFTDGLKPVDGLSVSFNNQSGTSNSLGDLCFEGVDWGDWSLMAALSGYRTLQTNLEVTNNHQIDLVVELAIDNAVAIVSPNPSIDRFVIQLPDGKDNATYRIINANGTLVKSGSSDLYRFEIDMSDCANGIYYLQLTYPYGNESLKLVKN